ncbi:hypothetical protein ACLOJK_016204, partial [Asimina triloba]
IVDGHQLLRGPDDHQAVPFAINQFPSVPLLGELLAEMTLRALAESDRSFACTGQQLSFYRRSINLELY